MSREIKFRGLRTDGKGWVYGHYWYDNQNKKHKITIDLPDDNFRCYEVIPESVGQFIGIKDSKGVDIYEGDVLYCEYWDGCEYAVEYDQDNRYIGYWFPKYDEKEIKVIGNIHSNE